MLKVLELISSGNRRVELSQESVAGLRRRFGALVSSDDNYLTHGGGLSAALWRAAGPALAASMETDRPRLSLGDVYATRPGRLDCDWLLHAITVDFDLNRTLSPSQVSDLVRRVLFKAEDLGCDSIALPLIGAGAGGLDVAGSCEVILEAVEGWLRSPTRLTELCIVTGGAVLPVFLERLRSLTQTLIAPEVFLTHFGKSALSGLLRRWVDTALLPPSERAFALAQVFTELVGRFSDLVRNAGDRPAGILAAASFSRNRLVHETSASATSQDLDALHRGVYEIVRQLAPSIHTLAFDSPIEGETVQLALKSARVKPSQAEPRRSASSRGDDSFQPLQESAAPLGIPIRKLHRLMLEKLTQETLSRIDRMLAKKGLVGSPELRLLEWLVRVEDPDKFLCTELPRRELECLCQGAGYASRHTEPRAIAKLLLHDLGFPSSSPVKGLTAVLAEMRSAKGKLLVPGIADISGIVSNAAKHLEYVCHVLIRFLCTAVFKQAPEPFLRRQGKLGPNKQLSKCTLGTLLTIVEYLAESIAEDEASPTVAVFKPSFNASSPFPEGISKLATLRNSLSHYQSKAMQETKQERVSKAEDFLSSTEQFLVYLQSTNPRVFPTIIRVERITKDNWGRELVTAVNDDGVAEMIFTDQPLNPGSTYFMHPLTNPLRVDPILVEAGDLSWPESET